MDGEVAPLGERMLRAKGTVSSGNSVTLVQWKVQEVGFEIPPNAIMSFWINVTESPGNLDHIVLEGNTTDGEISGKPWIVDQNGVPLDPLARNPPFGGLAVRVRRSQLTGRSDSAGSSLDALGLLGLGGTSDSVCGRCASEAVRGS